MNIDSLKIKPHGRGRRLDIRLGRETGWFHFTDLVEFSQGVARALRLSEGLVATNALHPDNREFLQLESVYVEDAGEHNRRVIAAREIRERRADGAKVCGGAWYMELCINGSATDCSFSTLFELFQQLQTIIRREMQQNGQVVVQGLTEMACA